MFASWQQMLCQYGCVQSDFLCSSFCTFAFQGAPAFYLCRCVGPDGDLG